MQALRNDTACLSVSTDYSERYPPDALTGGRTTLTNVLATCTLRVRLYPHRSAAALGFCGIPQNALLYGSGLRLMRNEPASFELRALEMTMFSLVWLV